MTHSVGRRRRASGPGSATQQQERHSSHAQEQPDSVLALKDNPTRPASLSIRTWSVKADLLLAHQPEVYLEERDPGPRF